MAATIIENKLTFGSMSSRSKTTEIIVHHAEWSTCTVEQIHNLHKNTNGWAGIGYHFFIRKDGKIYRGRPIDKVGAYCSGHNSNTIGICFEGALNKETPTDAQYNSCKQLISDLKKKYPTIKSVVRHKDRMSTDCPGKNFELSKATSGTSSSSSSSNGASSNSGSSSSSSSGSSSSSSKLSVDGKWGPATTKQLQKVLGTTQDGIVSAQHSAYKASNPGCLSTTFQWQSSPKKGGSLVIQALQKKLGITADGYIGPSTIKALQKRMGTVQDGILSTASPCIKAMQTKLNSGSLK